MPKTRRPCWCNCSSNKSFVDVDKHGGNWWIDFGHLLWRNRGNRKEIIFFFFTASPNWIALLTINYSKLLIQVFNYLIHNFYVVFRMLQGSIIGILILIWSVYYFKKNLGNFIEEIQILFSSQICEWRIRFKFLIYGYAHAQGRYIVVGIGR